jgi:hypothetical protein
VGTWLRSRVAAEHWNLDPNWSVITAAAEGSALLVSEPFTHAALVKRGAKAVPLFSPAVAFLFEPHQSLAVGLDRLRKTGVRFILLSPDNVINTHQLPRYPFFRALLATKPTVSMPIANLYDLFATADSGDPAVSGATGDR